MRFCLVTYGSRGDVQPFIALSLGLKANGHQVTLAAPGNFRQLITGFEINYHPLFGDSETLVNSPECQRVIQSGSKVGFVRMALKETHNMRGALLDDVYQACKDTDAVIAANPCVFYVANVAEKLGLKWMIVQLNPPMVPTKAFPMLMTDFPDVSWLNTYSYLSINYILYQLQKKDNAEFRQRMGLKPLMGSLFKKVMHDKIPMIHAFSEEIIQRPADWEPQITISGFLTLPKSNDSPIGMPPDGLSEWLDRGVKPLYIGFGSIPFPDSKLLSETIKHLLNKSDMRIVYCTGWSQNPDFQQHENLFVIKQADHSWLMPRCRAALIHGGIGTIAGVLKAGIPVIVASIFVDQPAWGKIIEKKKLGLHIAWRKLSANLVLRALTLVEQSPIADTVTRVSAQLNLEDGVSKTVKTIEAYCG